MHASSVAPIATNKLTIETDAKGVTSEQPSRSAICIGKCSSPNFSPSTMPRMLRDKVGHRFPWGSIFQRTLSRTPERRITRLLRRISRYPRLRPCARERIERRKREIRRSVSSILLALPKAIDVLLIYHRLIRNKVMHVQAPVLTNLINA